MMYHSEISRSNNAEAGTVVGCAFPTSCEIFPLSEHNIASPQDFFLPFIERRPCLESASGWQIWIVTSAKLEYSC
jgi:hypothetical protein